MGIRHIMIESLETCGAASEQASRFRLFHDENFLVFAIGCLRRLLILICKNVEMKKCAEFCNHFAFYNDFMIDAAHKEFVLMCFRTIIMRFQSYHKLHLDKKVLQKDICMSSMTNIISYQQHRSILNSRMRWSFQSESKSFFGRLN